VLLFFKVGELLVECLVSLIISNFISALTLKISSCISTASRWLNSAFCPFRLWTTRTLLLEKVHVPEKGRFKFLTLQFINQIVVVLVHNLLLISHSLSMVLNCEDQFSDRVHEFHEVPFVLLPFGAILEAFEIIQQDRLLDKPGYC